MSDWEDEARKAANDHANEVWGTRQEWSEDGVSTTALPLPTLFATAESDFLAGARWERERPRQLLPPFENVTFHIDRSDSSRWIPVAERMPEKGVPVIISWGSAREVSVGSWYGDADGRFHDWTDEGCVPSHWRALPAPPPPRPS